MIPGSRAPGIVQLLNYAHDPLGFLAGQQRRYGDIFALRFPYFGRIVYVAQPELVKALFTGDPAVFHAGEANATVLEPALGPSSVLTLDDGPHLRQRKLRCRPSTASGSSATARSCAPSSASTTRSDWCASRG